MLRKSALQRLRRGPLAAATPGQPPPSPPLPATCLGHCPPSLGSSSMGRSRTASPWNRIELLLHFTVVGAAALSLASKGYQFSRQFEQGQPWDGFAPGLLPGLWGRRVDLSDVQWRHFRAGLPAMAALFALAAGASRMLQRLGVGHSGRASFYLSISLPFMGYLHGAFALFVVALALLNFGVAKAVAGRHWGVVAVWSCNLGLLLIARLGNGFRFSYLNASLAVLDNYRGVMRWEICFNISVLRMLSFALDLHWWQRAVRGSIPGHESTSCREQQQAGQQPAESFGDICRPSLAKARWRHDVALPDSADYSMLIYLAYVLYPPLYLAGPIITYQDFAWQLRQHSKLASRSVACYGARLGADWLCLELLTHFLYFNSIAKHRIGLRYQPYGLHYGAIEMAMTAFWVLCFMWLKFATIWRFFRLAALLDGIDPPENMRRCFANNYDIEGFWRSWHASYNQWLVRYLYIPLGGSHRRVLVIWPVFVFVAVWHDMEWRLLIWAWLICIAFVFEMMAKQMVHSAQLATWRHTRSFRHISAIGAAINIAVLMAANLAGFVLGADGLQGALPLMLADCGLLAAAFATCFSAANIMFFLRQHN